MRRSFPDFHSATQVRSSVKCSLKLRPPPSDLFPSVIIDSVTGKLRDGGGHARLFSSCIVIAGTETLKRVVS